MLERNRVILELQHVTAGYRDQIVLEDVNLVVRETDFIGVIGANGCGKTTLLRVILGLNAPMKGSMVFDFAGNGNNQPSYYVGYLPQVAVFDRKFPMTVADVVLSGMASRIGLFKRYGREDRERAAQVMEQMGVAHLTKKGVGELSGGQMQRVFLARALINRPRLLLLDEPNTFVDKSFESGFFDILKELNREIAIILVSHDLGMISSYVKTIACVNRSVYLHDSNEVTQELLDNYKCPIDLITHGELPHRVLKAHLHGKTDTCHCLLQRLQDGK